MTLREESVQRVFETIFSGRLPPSKLGDLVKKVSEFTGTDFSVETSDLVVVASSGWSAAFQAMKRSLVQWDGELESPWSLDSSANSRQRRDAIYDLLEIDESSRTTLDHHVPFEIRTSTVRIFDEPPTGWYRKAEVERGQYYLDAYRNYLHTLAWSDESVQFIDDGSRTVMEFISDPFAAEARPKKGIVAGYVQSGKTANMTAVIARAVDAGYRYVVVLTGMTNLLRAQTQRRLDQTLVGREVISPSGQDRNPDLDSEIDVSFDYSDDSDWPERFILHEGSIPFSFTRMTGYGPDYRRIPGGIAASIHIPGVPFYDPRNAVSATVRLFVVKKNAAPLASLLRDVRQIANRDDVPILIIDDESDQASINTIRNLSTKDKKKRTRINQRIVSLLREFPRSQYIGYTATPFASVLQDPDDLEDLFPSDFIISLERPPSYMGPSDFHDLEPLSQDQEDSPATSNKAAFVRTFDSTNTIEDPTRIREAIDAFVLTGAIKLFRGSKGDSTFRHHTMLVHTSQSNAAQATARREIEHLWNSGSYLGGAGLKRLKRLFENDFQKVSNELRERVLLPAVDGGIVPQSFADVTPFVGEAIALISGDDPVIEVNGTDNGRDPDFDKVPVWKILIGGAKLSRGYTVEGLTVSYFRRRTNASDSLLQMGRWFGYRPGYADLVRIYVSENETHQRRRISLYDAFEAACRDEEEFRKQLRMYAASGDAESQVTPRQVPPLVFQHCPWLKPTSRNKMFNATIAAVDFHGKWSDATVVPTKNPELKRNADLFRDLFDELVCERHRLEGSGRGFDAVTGLLAPDRLITLIESYRWNGGLRPLHYEIEFLRGNTDYTPEVDDWVLIAPQLTKAKNPNWIQRFGDQDLHVFHRSRVGERIGVFTGPSHKAVAEHITGKSIADDANSAVERLRRLRRGVILMYPTYDTYAERPNPASLIVGISLLFPGVETSNRIAFRTLDNSSSPVVSRL